jgi:hypothetical protein
MALHEIDLQERDVLSLSPEEWDALKRAVVRRARAQRMRITRALFLQVCRWWSTPERDHAQKAYFDAGRISLAR